MTENKDFQIGTEVHFLVDVDGGAQVGEITRIDGGLIYVWVDGTVSSTMQFVASELELSSDWNPC